MSLIHPANNNAVPRRGFVAFGKGLNYRRAIGVLYLDVGNTGTISNPPKVVATGERIRGRRRSVFWKLRFRNLPALAQGDRFILVIYDANSGAEHARATGISLRQDFAVGIQYPASTDTVESDFITYGDSSDVEEHWAQINGTTTFGELLFGPPDNPGFWCFEFTGAPSGSRTLHVEGEENSGEVTFTIS